MYPIILIPTKNRPSSLKQVLSFLNLFYPGARVVIANGSSELYFDAYNEAVNEQDNILIDHQVFPENISFANRLRLAAKSIKEELIVIGADDDYPILHKLSAHIDFLEDNKGYNSVVGCNVALKLSLNGEIQAKMLHSRSFTEKSIAKRLTKYSEWPFATTYGLVRTSHFIERVETMDWSLVPFFGDYNFGIHDLVLGKMKSIPDICYFTTSVPNHSTLRDKKKTYYITEKYRTIIVQLLEKYEGLILASDKFDKLRASKLATKLINRKVAGSISPVLWNNKDFISSALFHDPHIQKQHYNFNALFRNNTKVRNSYIKQLEFIVESMRIVSTNKLDNCNEPKFYSSITEMDNK